MAWVQVVIRFEEVCGCQKCEHFGTLIEVLHAQHGEESGVILAKRLSNLAHYRDFVQPRVILWL